MKKKIGLLLLLILFLNPHVLRAQLVDRVVAVVNDDVITLSEIEQEGKPVFKKIASQVPASELEATIKRARKEILSSLIDKLLVEQRAKQLDVTTSDDEVKEAMRSVAANNGMDLDTFKRHLIAEGYTIEEYSKQIRWQILQSKLISYEISSKVVVTDEKAKQYYENQKATEGEEDGYHILQIGMQWGEGKKFATRQNALLAAKELKQKLAAGSSFAEMVHEYSNLPSSKDEGDLGVLKEDELSGDMKKAILAMHPGDISPLIETSDQTVQILKLISLKSGDKFERAPFESVKDGIIRHLQQMEMEKQFDRWVKDIREQAYIKKML